MPKRTAKTETGLDQYRSRRYDAWYLHITLAMLAHAYLSATQRMPQKALAVAVSTSRSAKYAVLAHLQSRIRPAALPGHGPSGAVTTSTVLKPATTSEETPNTAKCG